MARSHDPTRRAVVRGGLALLAAWFAFGPVPARAQTVREMLAAGAVGERFDGLLEARDPSAQGFVNQVNAQRRQIYAQRAAQQGVPADQVGRVYAQQLIQQAPAGAWIRGEDGRWVRK